MNEMLRFTNVYIYIYTYICIITDNMYPEYSRRRGVQSRGNAYLPCPRSCMASAEGWNGRTVAIAA
jgi:hypothetical protein